MVAVAVRAALLLAEARVPRREHVALAHTHDPAARGLHAEAVEAYALGAALEEAAAVVDADGLVGASARTAWLSETGT